ncbi:hypothetical protein EVAR_87976_1 [Eumeta japonica]|uniref:Uncharacterized protein n=1 Tax=Eumeta variegata TaxID=151549 RepID=A0A4C1VDQ0_EUMVA|nr:hypothetical protein EVAR_87976_1 [Eumeta japonica]
MLRVNTTQTAPRHHKGNTRSTRWWRVHVTGTSSAAGVMTKATKTITMKPGSGDVAAVYEAAQAEEQMLEEAEAESSPLPPSLPPLISGDVGAEPSTRSQSEARLCRWYL